MSQGRQLKARLIVKDGRLKESAKNLHMRQDRLSKILNGYSQPNNVELLRIANYLECQIEDLFPQP